MIIVSLAHYKYCGIIWIHRGSIFRIFLGTLIPLIYSPKISFSVLVYIYVHCMFMHKPAQIDKNSWKIGNTTFTKFHSKWCRQVWILKNTLLTICVGFKGPWNPLGYNVGSDVEILQFRVSSVGIDNQGVLFHNSL